jgi:hypothetical protein
MFRNCTLQHAHINRQDRKGCVNIFCMFICLCAVPMSLWLNKTVCVDESATSRRSLSSGMTRQIFFVDTHVGQAGGHHFLTDSNPESVFL